MSSTRWDDTRAVVLSLLVALVVASTAVTVVSGGSWVTGEPDLELAVADNHFDAGRAVQLDVSVANSGRVIQGGPERFEQRVKTARNVRFRVLEDRIDAPIDVKTGTVLAGTIPEGSAGPYRFKLELGESLAPGTYRIPIEVRYEYTFAVEVGGSSPRFSDATRQRVKQVEIVVEEDATFSIVSESAELVVPGDTGRLTFTLRNDGSVSASDAVVRLTAETPDLFFGDLRTPQRTKSVFVTQLEPGETTRVAVVVGAAREASPGSYPITAIVEYENANGIRGTSEQLQIGQTVGAERTFALRNVTVEGLRVGETDAFIRAEIVNTGPLPANETVVFLSTNGSVQATSSEAAVGDLTPGEAAPVEFKLAVSGDAEPGTREFTFPVKYENAEGDVRRAIDPIRRSFRVGESTEEFAIVGVNASLEAGDSTVLRVQLRNTGNYTVTDVSVKLFLDNPLSTSDDSAFLGRMEPGESKPATFRIAAANNALPKAYEGTIDVQYRDRFGDTRLSDELRIGIPVQQPSAGVSLPQVAVLVGGVVLAIGIALAWRRWGLPHP